MGNSVSLEKHQRMCQWDCTKLTDVPEAAFGINRVFFKNCYLKFCFIINGASQKKNILYYNLNFFEIIIDSVVYY